MTDIKGRHPAVQARIAQSQVIENLILVIHRQIGQTLTPGVIGRPIQALGEALMELYLQSVVAAPSAVINKVQAAVGIAVGKANRVWIEQEEVDRVKPGRVGKRLGSRAGAEVAAEHAAYINLVSGQSVGEGACLTIK